MLLCNTLLPTIGYVVKVTSPRRTRDNSFGMSFATKEDIERQCAYGKQQEFSFRSAKDVGISFFNKRFFFLFHFARFCSDRKMNLKLCLIFYLNIHKCIVGFTVPSQRLTSCTSLINW